jgi:excisionase family DNA binding protein
MITVPQAAVRTGRDAETIRRWIRSGKLRARKIGTQHVVDEQDLQALMEKETVPVPDRWKKTSTGEPMLDIVAAIRRSRAGH